MADVVIRGMKMPTSCNACELAALVDISDGIAYGCRALKEMIYNDRERLPNCPLVRVPPHSDLIDRDKLREKEFIHDGDAYAVVMSRDIRNAPTVIPAEEDE